MNSSKFAVAVLCLMVALAASPIAAQEKPVVIIETSMGDITMELNAGRAPVSVENFLGYVKAGFYDGTIFHRVIASFMIQGGGFTPDMTKKPVKDPIKNEAQNGLRNRKYTVAMARTNEVDSATAQFFINTKDNSFLDNKGTTARDYGYAVFGKIVDGMDIVDAIDKVKTTTKSGFSDVPAEPVMIKTIRLK